MRKEVNPFSPYNTVQGFVWIYLDAFVSHRESYVHVVAEQGPRSILQPALMGSTVQNPGEHRVQRQLLLHRGVIKAPAPATAVRGEYGAGKKVRQKVSTVIKVSFSYTQYHSAALSK